ncbi:MAG: hypothetical protein QM661_03605 [Solimonas sp.]
MNRVTHLRTLRTLAAVAMLAPLAALAQGGPPQGDDQHREHQAQHESHGQRESQGSPKYNFRDEDRAQLQQHYRSSLKRVDTHRRPQFAAGQEIPRAYRGYVTPAPAAVRAHLPPPPDGYTVGYYQGYTVVYDPTTFVILSVVDLLTH